MTKLVMIIRDKAAWDAYCADGRASWAAYPPPDYPCAVVAAWTTPAFFTVDHARTLLALDVAHGTCGYKAQAEQLSARLEVAERLADQYIDALRRANVPAKIDLRYSVEHPQVVKDVETYQASKRGAKR